jgi:glutamyl-tRNA synthetase
VTETRVRFAPSPTGYFHVGGARTALWNWLFARQVGGAFVLRIEDTDKERNREDWVDGIISALQWLGIDWDEGPYRQSERGELYRSIAGRLWSSGHAYYCGCTREEVEARALPGAKPGYDGHCRDLGLEPGPGRALRFRVPDTGTTIVHDLIRGDVEFANDSIEDFVIARPNGDALFVLAVVADDMDMRVTHIMRGEEHLPTTPKAILIWEALGGPELPVFAHVPVLVNAQRQKLSKRRDKVALEDYRAKGYLADAMRNYLVVLGWSPPDGREILTVDEMIAEFSLADVNNSPAFFDEKRLAHFNGVYIRAMSVDEFIAACSPFVSGDQTDAGDGSGLPWEPAEFDADVFRVLAPLAQERVATLGEVPGYVAFAFVEKFAIDEQSYQRAIAGDEVALEILRLTRERLTECEFSPEVLKLELEGIASDVGRKLGKAQAPVRVATMGSTVGLPLFESLTVLGRGRTLERLDAAIERASATAG